MLQTKRILVVDDHPDAADTLATLLRYIGHEAEALTDPRLAIPAAKRFRPHIAVLDLKMPHIDGADLARAFRADPDLEQVCLVALTAYNDAGHRRITHQAGFRVHLVKPATTAMVASMVGQCGDEASANAGAGAQGRNRTGTAG